MQIDIVMFESNILVEFRLHRGESPPVNDKLLESDLSSLRFINWFIEHDKESERNIISMHLWKI